MTGEKLHDKVCLKCQGAFRARPRTRYCSRACGIVAFYDKKGRKGSKNYRGICEACGQAYQRRYFYKGGRACSLSCGAKIRESGRKVRGYPTPRPVVQKGAYLREYAPDHPKRDKDNRVAQHRLVMERHIGRMLEDWEKVHHRNAVKTDNRIQNLEVVTHARPNGRVICPYCRHSFEVH